MVMMLRPSSRSVSGTQALQGSPSIRTVQAPQAPSEQPSLAPVRCSSSRRKRSSFWFLAAVTDRPFTVNVAMGSSLALKNRRGVAAAPLPLQGGSYFNR